MGTLPGTAEYHHPFVVHHGGICVVDWCVETTTVFPKDTVSLVSTHVECERLICDAKLDLVGEKCCQNPTEYGVLCVGL